MTNFNRLKQLSEDTNVIAEALKKSKSGLIQVPMFTGWPTRWQAKKVRHGFRNSI